MRGNGESNVVNVKNRKQPAFALFYPVSHVRCRLSSKSNSTRKLPHQQNYWLWLLENTGKFDCSVYEHIADR